MRDIPGDPEDSVIVTAIIAMAHSLGMEVTAEGVENSEQLCLSKKSEVVPAVFIQIV